MAEIDGIIAKHKVIASELTGLFYTAFHLVEEIHAKRCYARRYRGKDSYAFRPRYEFELKPFYTKVLHMGRKGLSDRVPGSTFSIFNCYMEDVMFRELVAIPSFVEREKREEMKLIQIYYPTTDEQLPLTDRLHLHLDPQDWTIHPTDSSGDLSMIMRFRDLLVDFMHRNTEYAERVLGKSHIGSKLMKRELNCYVKITSGLY